MIEHEQEQQGGVGEAPTDDELDVEGPNESTEPSGAPGLDEDDGGGGDGDAEDASG
jgi:hypothetical protein